ncbi:putative ubiqitin hydrolase [Leptomonas seymouri]|uniref:Putative ubiqitin hydrolase n=1 Tax=Leptomonas seymouri TaxID=5684 RepID=A0A0N1PDX7_LEPSE|nr:putative ubiqitin hydrolase [Leptomonas seymouri]|eukprot:KPI86291.1 putative ubiqitin hydrolase [Leptomonas seymouri]
MPASVTAPLRQTAVQSEGSVSFTIAMEEDIALQLDDGESSAVLQTPLRNPTMKGSAEAAGAPHGAENGSSIGSSFASPGVSITNDRYPPPPHTQPPKQGDCPVNATGSLSSRPTTGVNSVGSTNSLQLVTCQACTPGNQREAEAEADRDPVFHPMIVCPLYNLGNTCYFNSGVQMLANCPAFIYGLRNSPLFQPTRTNSPLRAHTVGANSSNAAAKLCLRGGDSTHALFEEFAALLARMENDNLASGEALSPTRALDALARVYPQFEGRSQQDAAEMMTALLASFEEEGGQYAEVEQLLRSFEEDAKRANQNRNNNGGDGTPLRLTPDHTAPASNSASDAVNRGETRMAEDFSPLTPLTPAKTASTLPGARSAHDIAILRFMKQVNAENEELERRTKQRQGKPYLGTFSPPRLHFNPVTDGFRGYAVSQVLCHHCHSVSRVVSDYNALLIDVPTNRQRSQFAANHPNLRRLAPDGQPLHTKKHARFTWWNPLSVLTSTWDRIAQLFTRTMPFPLTLQECLDIHFEPEKLQGSNKYHCCSCGTISEATKSESLLGLPEYLLLHMKRFKAGRCFNGKKTDPVIFPASWTSLTEAEAAKERLQGTVPEILDLRRYLHSVSAPFAEPIPRCLKESFGASWEEAPQWQASGVSSVTANNGNIAMATSPSPQVLASSPNGTTPWAIPTTYTLDGIVNHHGGYEGGHYTVYLYKTTPEQRTWVYISDNEIAHASAGEAADSEEYVLLYRRQPIVQPALKSNEGEQLRQKACYYLSREVGAEPWPVGAGAAMHTCADAPAPSSSAMAAPSVSFPASSSLSQHVYISRMWLQRVAFLREPGPIVNRLCYCTQEDQKKVATHRSLFPTGVMVPRDMPHVHGPPVDWFYVPITRADYNIFYDAFGGNAPLTAEEVEAIRQMQERFVAALSTAERAKSRGFSTASCSQGQR